MRRPSLLLLMASAAGFSAIVNGVSAATPATPAAVDAADPDLTRLGVAIREDLGQRQQAAAQRNRALELREQAARAAEARLKTELEARQQSPGAAGAAGKQPEPKDQFEDLARIFQAMKPAKAAAVFEELDLDLQRQVARRMRERSTALLLGAMSPRAAAALSMAMAMPATSAASLAARNRPGSAAAPAAAVAAPALSPAPAPLAEAPPLRRHRAPARPAAEPPAGAHPELSRPVAAHEPGPAIAAGALAMLPPAPPADATSPPAPLSVRPGSEQPAASPLNREAAPAAPAPDPERDASADQTPLARR